MSKAVKGAVVLLILLLLVSVGLAVYTYLQKQTADQQNQSLQTQIDDYKAKETKLLAKTQELQKGQQELTDLLGQKDKEKEEIQKMYDEAKSRAEEVASQLNQVTEERDDWKGRLDTIRQERDDLMQKLKNRPEKIVYKEAPAQQAVESAAADAAPVPSLTQPQGDQYWANVLKEKSALQLDLEKAKTELDQSALQVVELKKQNADMQIEAKNLADAKADLERRIQENQKEYERQIKYNEEMVNNLSLEVARSQTDKAGANERVEKIKVDNIALQSQIKQLADTKLALEKTIAQINQDKLLIQKKLTEAEGTIQGRINEIWQIKNNLDKKISELPVSGNGQVNLPPIIVNANGNQTQRAQQVQLLAARETPPVSRGAKVQGAIISINESNNFVIVDLGDGEGSQIGRKLTVTRDNNVIGDLEVIQVRKDISAADIKESSTKLNVGDIVRF